MIQSSLSKDIVPVASTVGNKYHIDLHGPKPKINFDRELFRSFVFFVWIAKEKRSTDLLLSRKKFSVYETYKEKNELLRTTR